MGGQTILLITQDQLLVQRLGQAFASQGLPSPVVVGDGESAILELGRRTCGLCLLDHDVPSEDGLQTLARLHQRSPDLPVVMLSSAGSEAVAVAAFRSGVVDYIAKTPGFATIVGQRVRYILHVGESNRLPQPIVVGPNVADRLRQPTYQNRLRVIGRELDISDFRAISVWEVGGGLLSRGTRAGQSMPEALEFLDRDFPQLVAITSRGDGERRTHQSKLIPTGYEDLLRAIGRRLDTQQCEAVSIAELRSAVVVSGMQLSAGHQRGLRMPFEWVFDADGIMQMLDDAFHERSTLPTVQPGLLTRWVR